MKFEFAGKYAWNGAFIDPEEDNEERPFVTFANDIAQAVKYAEETLPAGAIIVALEREVIPEDELSFEVDSPAIAELMKKQIN